MRFFLISTVLISFLFSFEITCKGKIKIDTIYGFEQKAGYSLLVNQGELEDGLIYGDIDPANSPITYYDNRSAVCGGSLDYNRLIVAYCDYNFDGCYEVVRNGGGYDTIIYKDGKYTNNVIFKGVYACLPYGVSSVSVAFYDYDNNDIGFGTFQLSGIEEEIIENLTPEEDRSQREYCLNLLKYVDDWENILDTQKQSLNQNIVNVNSFQFDLSNNLNNLNNSLQNLNNNANNNNGSNDDSYDGIADTLNVNPDISSELEGFKTDIENSILNSFTNYSNVFGFGGYGSPPSPISFDLLGNNYNAFDISDYDEYLPLFRGAFISFAYLWGFILTVRTLS